jgi:CheY-like chemotaxis protein
VAGARLRGRKNVGAEQQSLVQAMQRSADHLLALVNDVLDHSRLEAREMRFDPIEFSLRDLTASALEMFGAVAQSKEIALRLDHDETIHDVWIGDPTRLRQVLANLLSNAVKFTPWRGQVVLRVSPAMAPGGGTALRFEVQDSGPGISAQTQARLFKPYEQGDASITRRYGGTGLGLSICKELLRLMQGTIEVESKLGVGSTFRVLVPIERAIANLHHPLTTRAMDHAMLPVDLTVLLVEDDAVNRMVMEAVLRDIGVKVLTAESGERALDLLERASIGLVLMDCQMPDMDGLTTTRRWRSKEATRQRARVPVIALTGEAHSGARLACLDAGMDDYLTKPVSGRDLNAMLARWATPRSPALARH